MMNLAASQGGGEVFRLLQTERIVVPPRKTTYHISYVATDRSGQTITGTHTVIVAAPNATVSTPADPTASPNPSGEGSTATITAGIP